jgi:hypothetical protein
MGLVERNQPVDAPLGMNPAQRRVEDIELPGIVAHNTPVRWKAMGQEAAHQGPFGRDSPVALAFEAESL